LAGRGPRRKRSEGREAAEQCPTVDPRCSSPGTVASLAWHPRPFSRHRRPHTHGLEDCSTCRQTRRAGHARDAITETPRMTATGHLTVYGQPLRWPREPCRVAFPVIPAPRQARHARARGLLCLWADQARAPSPGHPRRRGGARGPADPPGPPGAPRHRRSARCHGHGPARCSWRRGAPTPPTSVVLPATASERHQHDAP
jgi:hypothetical protein